MPKSGLSVKIMAKMLCSRIYSQLFCCVLVGSLMAMSLVMAANPPPASESEIKTKKPTIFIPILARNKAHTLPHFFGYLERLNYPKDRITLWIRADHSVDNTIPMLREWIQRVAQYYHTVDYAFEESPKVYALEKGPHDWPAARFNHLINLRDEALQEARNVWADYLFTMDVDNFVWEQDILDVLMNEKKTIIAPMLQSTTYYSNFWGGVTSKGFYKRTKEYVKIVKRNVTGVFKVPMVHSTYLINLNHEATDRLTYKPRNDYHQDLDDMLTFAHSAKKAGIPFYIMNKDHYGAMLFPPESHHPLKEEVEQMLHTKLETMLEDHVPMSISPFITLPEEKPANKMGFDEIYLINLERRPHRRLRMQAALKLLRIDFKLTKAIDGKLLSPDILREMGIDMLPGYADPYWGRVLTKGEIGCFLSHYNIWKEVVERNLSRILIFEDDIRFGARFKPRMASVMAEVAARKLEWDLIYVGRKILQMKEEKFLSDSSQIVKPSYSYWTLSYMLSLEGAKKLLAQEPLGKMVPVDEYLPIMFDKHPEDEWLAQFHPRDLKAFSVDPLMVSPTHYTGEKKYFSDTETSSIWEELAKGRNGKPSVERKNETSTDGNTQNEQAPSEGVKHSESRKDTPNEFNQITPESGQRGMDSGQKHSGREEL